MDYMYFLCHRSVLWSIRYIHQPTATDDLWPPTLVPHCMRVMHRRRCHRWPLLDEIVNINPHRTVDEHAVWHERPTILWQRATSIISGSFAGRTWKNNEWDTYPAKLMCIYLIYKCDRGSRNTTGRRAPRVLRAMQNDLRLTNLPATMECTHSCTSN